MNNYTVYVGGFEVNDFYLTLEEAEKIAAFYIKKGYEDISILKV
jgi:hypothetical protein